MKNVFVDDTVSDQSGDALLAFWIFSELVRGRTVSNFVSKRRVVSAMIGFARVENIFAFIGLSLLLHEQNDGVMCSHVNT